MHRNLVGLTTRPTHPRPSKLVMLEVRRQARRELLRRQPSPFEIR